MSVGKDSILKNWLIHLSAMPRRSIGLYFHLKVFLYNLWSWERNKCFAVLCLFHAGSTLSWLVALSTSDVILTDWQALSSYLNDNMLHGSSSQTKLKRCSCRLHPRFSIEPLYWMSVTWRSSQWQHCPAKGTIASFSTTLTCFPKMFITCTFVRHFPGIWPPTAKVGITRES